MLRIKYAEVKGMDSSASRLLTLAHVYELATEWHTSRPALESVQGILGRYMNFQPISRYGSSPGGAVVDVTVSVSLRSRSSCHPDRAL